MDYHNPHTLIKYWELIERTKKKEFYRLPIVSYFNILRGTKGFELIDLSNFKLTERTIKDEIIKWFNLGLLKQQYLKYPLMIIMKLIMMN